MSLSASFDLIWLFTDRSGYTPEKGYIMEITIFAKKRTSSEGKPFTAYLSTLTKKSGEKLICSVRFCEDCKTPKAEECPMNIVLQKGDCNLSQREYTDENSGETRYSSTLWVKAWKPGKPYEDTSMDEFF